MCVSLKWIITVYVTLTYRHTNRYGVDIMWLSIVFLQRSACCFETLLPQVKKFLWIYYQTVTSSMLVCSNQWILYNLSSNYFQKIAMSNQTLTPTSLNSTFKHTSSSTHTFHFDYSSANPALTNCYLLIAIFLLLTLHHHKSKYSVSMYFINLKKYLTCFGK